MTQSTQVRRRIKNESKSLFGNAQGIVNLKDNGWKYVRKFEVVGITETLEQRMEGIKKNLKGYEVMTIASRRERTKGRGKGEMLITEKKIEERKTKELEAIRSEKVLAVEITEGQADWEFALAYMIEMRKETWERMEMLMEPNARKKLILGEDFIVGTGSERGWLGEEGEGWKKK